MRSFNFKRMIELFKEYQYEYSDFETLNKFGFPAYHRPIFALRFFFVWLINWTCPYCRGEGITGYEYREACNECDGFGINVHFNLRQMWINFWHDKEWEKRSFYEFDLYYRNQS